MYKVASMKIKVDWKVNPIPGMTAWLSIDCVYHYPRPVVTSRPANILSSGGRLQAVELTPSLVGSKFYPHILGRHPRREAMKLQVWGSSSCVRGVNKSSLRWLATAGGGGDDEGRTDGAQWLGRHLRLRSAHWTRQALIAIPQTCYHCLTQQPSLPLQPCWGHSTPTHSKAARRKLDDIPGGLALCWGISWNQFLTPNYYKHWTKQYSYYKPKKYTDISKNNENMFPSQCISYLGKPDTEWLGARSSWESWNQDKNDLKSQPTTFTNSSLYIVNGLGNAGRNLTSNNEDTLWMFHERNYKFGAIYVNEGHGCGCKAGDWLPVQMQLSDWLLRRMPSVTWSPVLLNIYACSAPNVSTSSMSINIFP